MTFLLQLKKNDELKWTVFYFIHVGLNLAIATIAGSRNCTKRHAHTSPFGTAAAMENNKKTKALVCQHLGGQARHENKEQ